MRNLIKKIQGFVIKTLLFMGLILLYIFGIGTTFLFTRIVIPAPLRIKKTTSTSFWLDVQEVSMDPAAAERQS